jgi:hypothetical protein
MHFLLFFVPILVAGCIEFLIRGSQEELPSLGCLTVIRGLSEEQ